MQSYPDLQTAVNCAGRAVAIARAGHVLTKKEEFALNVWNVQGFAQKVAIGEPGAVAAATHLDDCDREKFGELQLVIEEELAKGDDVKPKGAAEAARERPFLRGLLEMLLPILIQFLVPKVIPQAVKAEDEKHAAKHGHGKK